jgi:choline-sulfatase
VTAARPNILFIMADQMAAPALRLYGGKVARTPHLDALAQTGLAFSNAYCASPLCAPSRVAMLTGQLASRVGAFDNASEFRASVPTFAHYLRLAGYRTCLSGKSHFIGPDQLHGFEERVTTDIYPADFGWVPDWERPDRRIDWWYHNMLSVVQAGICERSNQLDFDDEVAFHASRKLYELARQPDGRPFFLTVSFTHPHDPYAIRKEYWDRYRDDEIDPPAAVVPADRLDPHSVRLRRVSDMDRYDITPERIARARHAYYGAMAYVDDRVGELMRILDSTGRRGDTIVIFTSDHGDMLGEHGLWYKMTWFEWAARVPLIVNWPGQIRQGFEASPVSHLDLLPTLVEIARDGKAGDYAEAPDGTSLTDLFGKPGAPGARTVIGDYCGEGAAAPLVMIRRGAYKFVRSPGDPDQLYDLSADPLELANRAGDPALAGIAADFTAEAERRWDFADLHARVIASQRRRRLVHDAAMTGRHTSWDFQPYQDAGLQYMRNHLDLNELEARARYPAPPIPAPDGPDRR